MCYKSKSKIWIEAEGKALLGEGKVHLLNAIKETGSISKAAQKIQMSYKKAWGMINLMNQSGKKPIVNLYTGGKGGGGARLTPYGNDLIKIFEIIWINRQIK